MHISRLDHIQLAMPKGEEAKARAFYEGLLGIPEVPKPQNLAARGGCWFEVGLVKSISVSTLSLLQREKRIRPSLSIT